MIWRATMPRSNVLQRFARRCPGLRFLAIKYVTKARAERRDANWKYVHSVLASVGNLISSWGFIERQINTLIAGHYPHADERLRRDGLPSSLTSKIKYLHAMSKDERLPADMRSSLSEWIPEIGRLKRHRDLVVHGNFAQIGMEMRWRAQLLTLKAREPHFEEHILSHEDLQQKATEIHQLSHKMASVLNPLLFGKS